MRFTYAIELIVIFCLGFVFGATNTTQQPYLDLNNANDTNDAWRIIFGTQMRETDNRYESLSQRLEALVKLASDLSKQLEEEQTRINQQREDLEIKKNTILAAFKKTLEEQEATRKQLEEDLEINNRLNSLTKQQELFLADIESNDWKIILRRQDGSENFNRNWTDYKSGFGNPNGEFFIGLEVLHNLTNNGPPQELVVVMRNFGDEERHVKYDLFRVGNEAEKYALLDLGVFSGNLNFDALRSHRGAKFSTPDQKNNARNSTHCYNDRITSGWWYMDCGHCYLTGPYRTTPDMVNWDYLHWWWQNVKFAEMKIRANK